MNLNYDPNSHEFWSSLSHSFAVPDPKDDLYPGIRTPIMAMPISMAVDVPAEPWKVVEDGHKEAGPWNNAAAEVGANINCDELGAIITWKPMEKGKEKEEEKEEEKQEEKQEEKEEEKQEEKQDAGKEETKSPSKRPRSEARNMNEKRRRTDINAKIKTLKELTRCNEKKDLVSSLDYIIIKIREMKLYVEGFYYGPMMPMGMGMEYPGPWMYPAYNYAHQYYMMPYNPYIHGQTGGYGNQVVPSVIPYQGVNYQPQTAPMPM